MAQILSGAHRLSTSTIRAFKSIIENKVDSDRDRLYFLNKYTAGKDNEVIKGFVTVNSEDGYKEARKVLAKRFGDPFHVAQAYKAKLKKWPCVSEGYGLGLRAKEGISNGTWLLSTDLNTSVLSV